MEKPRANYLSWDECLMQIAHVIAQRSKDPSTQNGAVIVDPHHVIVGLGYNGWPRGVDNDHFPWDSEGDFLNRKNTYVVHAEENAIYNANKDTTGCILYAPLFPCNECAKTIIQKGIVEIVYETMRDANEPTRVAARRLFDAAGIKVRQYRSQLADEADRRYESTHQKTA